MVKRTHTYRSKVNKPGSYSRRALSILSDPTKVEAEIFTQLCGFVVDIGLPNPFDRVNREPKFRQPVVLSFKDKIYTSRGIDEHRLAMLSTIGLITFNLAARYSLKAEGERTDFRYFKNVADLYFAEPHRRAFDIGMVTFTSVGAEISNIAGATEIPDFLLYLGTIIRREGAAIVSEFPRRVPKITVTKCGNNAIRHRTF